MTIRRSSIPVKTFALLLSIACFLAFNLVAASPASAADPPAKSSTTWETWPKGSSTAGEAGGAATSAGINWGTWGWVLGGLAAAGLIAIAVGGGGSSSSAPVVCAQ